MSGNTLLTIDGQNLVYRWAWTGSPMTTSDDFPTGIIYGVLTTLRRLIDTHGPDRVIMAWDGGRDQRRVDLFPEYKRGRKKDKELAASIFAQIDLLRDNILPSLGIPQIRLRGREADDIIAILANANSIGKKHNLSYIYSRDEDFWHLIMDNLLVICPNGSGERDEILSPKSIEERFGFKAPLLHLYMKAICGESKQRDNIPGIRGVGEKTVQKFFEGFLIHQVREILFEGAWPGAAGEKIFRGIETVKRNLGMMKLTDLPEDLKAEVFQAADTDRSVFDPERFRCFIRSLEMDSIDGPGFEKWITPFRRHHRT